MSTAAGTPPCGNHVLDAPRQRKGGGGRAELLGATFSCSLAELASRLNRTRLGIERGLYCSLPISEPNECSAYDAGRTGNAPSSIAHSSLFEEPHGPGLGSHAITEGGRASEHSQMPSRAEADAQRKRSCNPNETRKACQDKYSVS